jgi:hypothetical protein
MHEMNRVKYGIWVRSWYTAVVARHVNTCRVYGAGGVRLVWC